MVIEGWVVVRFLSDRDDLSWGGGSVVTRVVIYRFSYMSYLSIFHNYISILRGRSHHVTWLN